MKDYKEAAFLNLSCDRQIKVSLDLVSKIEKSWSLNQSYDFQLEKLKEYLKLMSLVERHQKLKPLVLLRSIEGKITLRKVMNVALAFERSLGMSLKDVAFLVRSKDTNQSKDVKQPLYLVLDNLRSAHNVGSIFRTADCLGVEHIYLVGYTATPEDRSVKKTAMGSDDFVAWSHVEKVEGLIADLKNQNIKLAALETAESSVEIGNFTSPPGLALFLGNERFGLDSKCLKEMDFILEIPMRGRKNSLNVSNACAIAAFEILRSWSE